MRRRRASRCDGRVRPAARGQIEFQIHAVANLAHVQARTGRRDEARRGLQQLAEDGKERYVPALAFAVVWGMIGIDMAMTMLPTTTARNTIMIGSSNEVMAATALSTSSS